VKEDPSDLGLVREMGGDPEIFRLTRELFDRMCRYRYSYNFRWLGRPIIQFPQDIVAIQELLWHVKPDLVIETGVAHGGSLILSASVLELLQNEGLVLGIDIDIRPHNREAIEAHPLASRIVLIEGSSVDEKIVAKVADMAAGKKRCLVILDSNHTHDHVLRELQLYSPFVKAGSYLVVMDTVVDDMPSDFFPDRPWGSNNNPKTAVLEFLRTSDRFEVDAEYDNKLLITVAPSGYLKCIKD
jgi:cephalosporin hydroxylase